MASATLGCWFLQACHELLLSGSKTCWQGGLGHGSAVCCCGLRVVVFYYETSATLVFVAKPAPLHLGSQLDFFYSLGASGGQLHLLASQSPLHSAEQCEQPPTSWEKQWKKQPYSAPISLPLLTNPQEICCF